LDVRGLNCPIPVARTAQAAAALRRGELLEVLATDPDAELDVRAWAARSGDEVVAAERHDGVLRLLVRRA
jgi:TusA-related sulfurtransferase